MKSSGPGTSPAHARPRLVMLIAAVVTAVVAGIGVAARAPEQTTAQVTVESAVRLTLIAGAVWCLVRSLRGMRRGQRPAGFAVDPGRFRATTSEWSTWSAAGSILLNGAMLTALPATVGDGLIERAMDLTMIAIVAATTVVTVLLAAGTWRSTGIDLTPSGVVSATPLLHRTIPWGALEPGGPPLPPPGATHLPLRATGPDPVRDRGWAVAMGTRSAPRLALDVGIDPAFLAGAIRWYAEHPEHRPAIGTPAEHERLTTALGRDQPPH